MFGLVPPVQDNIYYPWESPANPINNPPQPIIDDAGNVIMNTTTNNPTVADIQCLWGTPFWNGTQWVCPSDTTMQQNNGIVKTVITPTVTPSTTVSVFSPSGLLAWVTAHPYLVLGGAALVLWFLFGRSESIRSRFR